MAYSSCCGFYDSLVPCAHAHAQLNARVHSHSQSHTQTRCKRVRLYLRSFYHRLHKPKRKMRQ